MLHYQVGGAKDGFPETTTMFCLNNICLAFKLTALCSQSCISQAQIEMDVSECCEINSSTNI